MFNIVCIADSDKHFSSAIEEYCKRLGKDLKIENLKPFKDDNHSLVIQKDLKIENLKPFKDDNHSLVIQKETKSLIYFLLKLAIFDKKNVINLSLFSNQYTHGN